MTIHSGCRHTPSNFTTLGARGRRREGGREGGEGKEKEVEEWLVSGALCVQSSIL